MDTNQKPLSLKLHKTLITSAARLKVKGFVRPGDYQIQLVVSDDTGRVSAPFIHHFTVKPATGFWQKLGYYLSLVFTWRD
jgi:hypothetical protein